MDKLITHYVHSFLFFYVKHVEFHWDMNKVEFVNSNKEIIMDLYLESLHCYSHELTSEEILRGCSFFIANMGNVTDKIYPIRMSDPILKASDEQKKGFETLIKTINNEIIEQ